MKSDNDSSGNSLTNADRQGKILYALPQVVLEVMPDNRITYANARAEQYFSTSSLHLSKMSLEELFPFASPILALVEQARERKNSINEYNVHIDSMFHKKRELMDLQVIALPVNQQTLVLVMQPRSITRKIERRLDHQGAARSVSGLASMLAHEIRNPLSGIKGAAQLLEADLNPSDRTLTSLIIDETDRISRLVARMEVFGDHHHFDRQELNIHSVLGHVLKLARSGFAKDLEFVENYDPSLPRVLGNSDLLVQLFLNLLKNAAQALFDNKRPGKIWLTTSYRQGVSFTPPGSVDKTGLPLQITVEDNGPGIPDEIANYLFDPFVTSKTNGTGLGLAMVAKCVKDHGGVIEVERRYERTIFKVLFPLASSVKTNQIKSAEDEI